MVAEEKKENRVIAENRKARHDYFIEEAFEAGIELTGTELKSIRAGRVNLKDSYATIKNGEIFLESVHISAYEQGNRFNHDPLRKRRLLMHKAQIRKLLGSLMQQGLTLVPLKFYFKRNLVKVELALVRGKKLYDKRDDLAKKEAVRDMERAIKNVGRE